MKTAESDRKVTGTEGLNGVVGDAFAKIGGDRDRHPLVNDEL